jgi:hypothetical protein
MPTYYPCRANPAHWTSVPDGTQAAELERTYCGSAGCLSPLDRARGTASLPPAAVHPAPRPLHRSRLFFRCATGHWSYWDFGFQPALRPAAACGECGKPVDPNDATPWDTPHWAGQIKSIVFDWTTRFRPIEEGIVHDTFEGTATVNVEDPHMFQRLCAFALDKFKQGARVRMNYGGQSYAVLETIDPSKPLILHPYCKPLDVANDTVVGTKHRYEDIGLQLMQYTSDFIHALVGTAMRAMKQRAITDDLQYISAVAGNPVIRSPQAPALTLVNPRWSPMSLLLVLIGSAACETGRGVVGYANVLATYQRIKHDVRQVWNQWADDPSIPALTQTTESIKAIYPVTYDFTGLEQKRNAVGFGGSEKAIKKASGLNENPEPVVYGKYKKFADRDVRTFSNHRKTTHPYYKPDAVDPGQPPLDTLERKVLRHLRAIFP